jgi:hypothetical protein
MVGDPAGRPEIAITDLDPWDAMLMDGIADGQQVAADYPGFDPLCRGKPQGDHLADEHTQVLAIHVKAKSVAYPTDAYYHVRKSAIR